MSLKVITQEGEPVDENSEEVQDDYSPEDDIRAMAEDIAKGVRKFKNGVLFKIGVIAVALKVVDVAGKIILENQRLKARKQNDEE